MKNVIALVSVFSFSTAFAADIECVSHLKHDVSTKIEISTSVEETYLDGASALQAFTFFDAESNVESLSLPELLVDSSYAPRTPNRVRLKFNLNAVSAEGEKYKITALIMPKVLLPTELRPGGEGDSWNQLFDAYLVVTEPDDYTGGRIQTYKPMVCGFMVRMTGMSARGRMPEPTN